MGRSPLDGSYCRDQPFRFGERWQRHDSAIARRLGGHQTHRYRPWKKTTDSLVASLADMTPYFPTTGAHFAVVPGDLALADMTGLSADDPQWDAYLAQFTTDELQTLVGRGGWVTDPIPEQGVPRSHSVDGPVGVIDYTTGTAGVGCASSVRLHVQSGPRA